MRDAGCGHEISSWYVLVDLSQMATCVWLASRLGVETVRVEVHLIPMQVIRRTRDLRGPLVPVPGACAPSEHSLFAGGGRLVDVQVSSRRTGRSQLRRQRVPAIQLATTTAESGVANVLHLTLLCKDPDEQDAC